MSLGLGVTPPFPVPAESANSQASPSCDNHGDDHPWRGYIIYIHLIVSLDTHINITQTIYFMHMFYFMSLHILVLMPLGGC